MSFWFPSAATKVPSNKDEPPMPNAEVFLRLASARPRRTKRRGSWKPPVITPCREGGLENPKTSLHPGRLTWNPKSHRRNLRFGTAFLDSRFFCGSVAFWFHSETAKEEGVLKKRHTVMGMAHQNCSFLGFLVVSLELDRPPQRKHKKTTSPHVPPHKHMDYLNLV